MAQKEDLANIERGTSKDKRTRIARDLTDGKPCGLRSLRVLGKHIIPCLVDTGYTCRKRCPSRFYRICRVALVHKYHRLPCSRKK